jgi:lambda family phage holin
MQEFLHDVGNNIVEYWLVIATVSMATLMAVFRTAKTNGKVDWLEAGMCGIFAYGIWFVLGYFDIPEGAGVLVGGVIGYKGTTLVSNWISNRLGINIESSKEGK